MAKAPRKPRKSKNTPSDRFRSLVDIGIAISSEKEVEKILDLILSKAMENTNADAASIFLTETIRIDSIGSSAKFYPVLRFHRTANRSTGLKMQNKVLDIDQSIAGHVARTGDTLCIDDCYELDPQLPYKFNPETDKELGYRTKSMLALPMQTSNGKVRGVLQIINKLEPKVKDHDKGFLEENILPFPKEDRDLMRAFASQASVAIENAKLNEDIENLFESFIRASITAIEARDPSTSGHSDRVAVLTVELARALHQTNRGVYRGVRFSDAQIREIRYAALLHDFGKIGVREDILNKEKKLYPYELQNIMARLDAAQFKQEMMIWKESALELAELLEQGKTGGAGLNLARVNKKIDHFQNQLAQIRTNLMKADQPQILEGEVDVAELITGINRISQEINYALITVGEIGRLSIGKGSLSAEERREINSHVSHTYTFLRQIAWTEDLVSVPDIAHAHHEKCDGSGYPRGITAAHIPIQSKLMAITDIYDALTAMDRPYKKAIGTERALDILNYEAKDGKLDRALLDIFIDAKIYMAVQGMLRNNRNAA